MTHIVQQNSISNADVGVQLTPDTRRGRVRRALEVPWHNRERFRRSIERQVIRRLGVPRAWSPQLIASSNVYQIYRELEARNPHRPDGQAVRVFGEFNATGQVGQSTLSFEIESAGRVAEVIETGPEEIIEMPPEGRTPTEELPETSPEEAVGEATRGSRGGPEESDILETFSRLDVVRETLGTGGALLELVGVSAAGTASAALGVAGAIAGIPLGLYSIGRANQYGYEVAYLQGYVLAFVDVSEGLDPNDRRFQATLGPNQTWENRGRIDAIRYLNSIGPEEYAPLFIVLRHNYPEPQARVEAMWPNLAHTLNESDRTRYVPRFHER